jgi:hypothetical protein
MTQEWIVDRLPTEADGDPDGDVRMKRAPSGDRFHLIHWSYVGAGVPWQHTMCWQPPAEPAPTEPDRIAALEQRVAELEAKLSPPSYEQAKMEHLRSLAALALARAGATLLDRGVAPEAQP